MISHNVSNPFLEVGASNSGYEVQWRSHAEFANLQNTLGVDLAIAPHFQHLFVAGAFALLQQTRSQPPNHWVKPEDGFNHHVSGGGQIVSTTYVAKFMRENGF